MISKFHFKESKALIFIISILLLIEYFICPFGEFPLNDDWCYAIPTHDLLQGKPLKLVNWGSMTLITHLIWGLIFTKFFGFSFFVLRLSVLTIHFISIIYLYLLLSKYQTNKILTLLLVLFYVFNPLVVSLSNTFMTDITFCGLCIICIFYYDKAYNEPKKYFYISISLFLTILILLTRQIGITLPLAYLVVSIIKKDKQNIISGIVLCISMILTLYLYEIWLDISENKVNNYFKPIDFVMMGLKSIPQLTFSFYHRLSIFLHYTGFFLFPIWGIYVFKNISIFKNINFPKMVLIVLPFIICSTRSIAKFPYTNVMSSVSVGAKILFNIFALDGISDYDRYPVVNIIFTLISQTGAVLFILTIYIWVSSIKQKKENTPSFLILFALGNCIFYILTMAFSDAFMDRYILPVFLSLIIFCTQIIKKELYPIMICYLLITVMFSIFTTIDYFNENRLRSIAYNQLKDEEKILPINMHFGIDMWGWDNYSHSKAKNWRDDFVQSNWHYILSYQRFIPNSNVYKTYTYQRYIPYQIDTLYLHKQ